MPPVPIVLQPVLCLLNRLPRLVLLLALPVYRPRVRALRRRPRPQPRLARRLRVLLPLAPRVVQLPGLLALRGRRQAPAINRR